MSIKVVAYVPDLSKELLAKIAARFADVGMECGFEPGFALDPAKDAGWVKLRLGNAPSEFEISFKDYRYTSPPSVVPAINAKLKPCTRQVVIRMHATPTNALRTGMYFASFLAQLTDGVVYVPRCDNYLSPEEALEYVASEVSRYEADLVN